MSRGDQPRRRSDVARAWTAVMAVGWHGPARARRRMAAAAMALVVELITGRTLAALLWRARLEV